ncbi:EmrB/QacA subfamily drug resistance transporter [Streptomyces sp. 840.1]|uniref:MFS transporter n=1 Tax=Streptomyces sp. 840.1 TaxID=2485152 RepID=UPI000F487998|nr:MFS transporter [Streptomyces sp. 840.1]ROQ60130.1 EmrB/QacA subfamily drug resistance transporter [Streptomyces sp. 840.1]
MDDSPAPHGPAPLRIDSARGRWTLLVTVVGSGVVMLGSTVTNVALPHIGDDFDAGLATLQWTVNAYMLTLAGLILLGGALGDRFGRRRVFVLGVVWFAVASLLCGLAPGAITLIAARALQGVGGALLTPGSLAIIEASFHPDDRPRAIGLWSGFGAVGAALGPLLGGWLVDGPGWRWTFLLSVVPALLCVPIALRHVPESVGSSAEDVDGTSAATSPAMRPRRHGFDVSGAVLGALTLALLTYALTEARNSGPAALAAAVTGLLAGAAFLRVERRGTAPMMPLSIFESRQFTAINLITLCVYAGTGGFFFLTAIQLQLVVGYSASSAGAAMLPTTVLMLLFSSRSGMLAQRLGARIPLTVGPLVCGTGMLMMVRVGPGSSYLDDVLPALLVMGTGMVVMVAPLTVTLLSSVHPSNAGLASGINNAAARAAGLLSVAALPLLIGMDPGSYRPGVAFATSFNRAMPLCAGLLAIGGAVAFVTLRQAAAPPRRGRAHSWLMEPPLTSRFVDDDVAG